MTATDEWLDIIARISDQTPFDIDAVLGSNSRTEGKAPPDFPKVVPLNKVPSVRIWERPEEGTAYIGIRVRTPVNEIASLAMRLAAAAVERKVIPVILTTLDSSGFERFGFRCERVFGADDTERAASEAELASFWNLAIVIDAAEVSRLS